MTRPIRFIPENEHGVLVEVTGRTIGARALLSPGPNPRRFNEVIAGVIGRALEVAPLEICACAWLSNHFHFLLVVRDQQQLSRFMHHLCGNVSKEVGRMREWRGPLWERRYDGVVISDEPEAQWARLKYVLAHGVKEGLVETPLEWPGVHAARSLVHGEPLEGYWFNRTKEWAARRRGQDVERYDYATRYWVDFAPLPTLRDLTPEEHRDKIAELLEEIEEEGQRARHGRPVAGVERILSQDPHEPPTVRTQRSPRPRLHSASRQVRAALGEERSAFLSQFIEASEALRLRRRFEAAHWFPEGSHPPALPFVGRPPSPRPPSPPTRAIEVDAGKVVGRGEIPEVRVGAALVARESGTVLELHARGDPA